MNVFYLAIFLFLLQVSNCIFCQDIESVSQMLGVVNDSRVRIRKEPNLDSENLGYLDKDQIIIILDETQQSMKIGKMNSVWYKIRTENGVVGWTYGYFINPDLESINDYMKSYYFEELPSEDVDVESVIYKHSDSNSHWSHIGFSKYIKPEGTPVYAKHSGRIIDICWFNDDSSRSLLVGFEGRSTEIQGIGFGFYILVQSDQEFYIYAHLNPEAESTLFYQKLLQDNPDSEILNIKQGTQIGEFGKTGTSWESNLLYLNYTMND